MDFLKQFCNAKGIIVNQCIEDFGSGLNYNRKKWNQLLDDVMGNRIKIDSSVLVMIGLKKQDIISILHVFSCRLPGLRKYKNQIKGDGEIVKELQNGNKPKS